MLQVLKYLWQKIDRMKYIFPLLFCFSFNSHSQRDSINTTHRGFFFSTAVGCSATLLSDPYDIKQNSLSLSFPNFKFGYSFSNRFLAGVYLPGSIYTYEGPGRTRDRGFEGIIPFAQYWPAEKWWILGGAGITLDAPAFYDVEGQAEADFYFGPSILAGAGYELWKKGKFALDIQARTHLGFSVLADGHRQGFASSVLIGFNWY